MSIIDPPAGWDDVDGINTNERLLGGPGGPLNRAAEALTARTKQLRDDIELISGSTGGEILKGRIVPPEPARVLNDILSKDLMIATTNYLTVNPNGDVRAQLQTAINAAATPDRAGRREVVFRARDIYQISDVLTVPSGVRLIFDGDGRFIPTESSVSLGSGNGLRSYGAFPVLTYPPTADMYYGSYTVPAGSSAVMFAPGDYVWISSTDRIDTSPNSRDIPKAQMAKVVAVEGSNLVLDRLLEYNFPMATSSFGKPVIMQNVSVEGFRFGDPTMNVRSGRGIDFRLHDNLSILNSDVGWSRTSPLVGQAYDQENVNAINLVNCSNTTVDTVNAERVGWYGVCVDGASHNVVVRNATVRVARHGVSLNWNGPGEPMHVKVCDSQASRTSLACFDTHDVGRYITFDNLWAQGGDTDGFQFRTNDCTGSNLVAQNCPQVGLRVYAHTAAAATTLRGLNFKNIRIQNCAVGVSGIAPYNISSFLVDGSTSAGLTTMGGLISDGIITNSNAAVIYQPAPSYLGTAIPLTVSRVSAPASAAQTYFLRSTRTFQGANVRLRDCDVAGYAVANRVSRTDGNTFIADVYHSGCAWGANAREGTLTLVAGAASVANDNIFSSASFTATGVFRSHVHLQRLTAGAAPGALTLTQTDGNLAITSSAATDAGVIEWRIA